MSEEGPTRNKNEVF